MFAPLTACLFCGDPVGNFEPGPRGGMSQNMTCRRCGARYNLLMPNPAVAPVIGVFLEVLEGPRNAVPLSDAGARQAERELGVKEWPGYDGLFTRDRAGGALPNGTRVVKTKSEPGDRFPDDTPGTILGSLTSPLGILYFVEWDTMPKVAIGVAWNRVRGA